MGDNSLITQSQLQSDLESFYNTKVYPYLNGSAKLGFTPIGTVISVMSNEAPDNYLVCDGTTYNIQDYSDLANFFEEQFGSKNYFGGDGTTTFAVPDLRGEFLRGTGTNSHADQGSGANVGVHQDATIFPSMYTNNEGNFQLVAGGGNVNAYGTLGNGDSSYKSGSEWAAYSYASKYATTTDTIRTSRPTNTSVLYCIAYKNIYFEQRHEYSTEEHVVGTWVDGRPLYEKTYVDTTQRVFQPHTQTQVSLETDASKQLRFCNFGVYAAETYGGYVVMPMTPILTTDGTAYFTAYSNQNPSGEIRLVFSWADGGIYTVDEIWATYRYTKSTD